MHSLLDNNILCDPAETLPALFTGSSAKNSDVACQRPARRLDVL